MALFSLLVNNIETGVRVRLAKDFLSKATGFMFRIKPCEAILLPSCNSIHTFFMNFDLDAVFLDRQNRVVKIIRGIKPWRIVLPVNPAESVLELPVGIYDPSLIKTGDRLILGKTA